MLFSLNFDVEININFELTYQVLAALLTLIEVAINLSFLRNF
jgi:hypothetical protein